MNDQGREIHKRASNSPKHSSEELLTSSKFTVSRPDGNSKSPQLISDDIIKV